MKILTLLVSLLLLNACGKTEQNLRHRHESNAQSPVSSRNLGLAEDGELVEESYQIARTRKDEAWTDAEAQALCEASAADKKGDATIVSVVALELIHTRNCYRRNFQRTCYKWFQGLRVNCQVTLKYPKPGVMP